MIGKVPGAWVTVSDRFSRKLIHNNVTKEKKVGNGGGLERRILVWVCGHTGRWMCGCCGLGALSQGLGMRKAWVIVRLEGGSGKSFRFVDKIIQNPVGDPEGATMTFKAWSSHGIWCKY